MVLDPRFWREARSSGHVEDGQARAYVTQVATTLRRSTYLAMELAYPLPIKGGEVLRTIQDARDYLLRQSPGWEQYRRLHSYSRKPMLMLGRRPRVDLASCWSSTDCHPARSTAPCGHQRKLQPPHSATVPTINPSCCCLPVAALLARIHGLMIKRPV